MKRSFFPAVKSFLNFPCQSQFLLCPPYFTWFLLTVLPLPIFLWTCSHSIRGVLGRLSTGHPHPRGPQRSPATRSPGDHARLLDIGVMDSPPRSPELQARPGPLLWMSLSCTSPPLCGHWCRLCPAAETETPNPATNQPQLPNPSPGVQCGSGFSFSHGIKPPEFPLWCSGNQSD